MSAAQVLTAAQMNAITTLPINDQTASYVALVGDVGKRIVMNVTSANTVTINNSVFATGDTIFIANTKSGLKPVTNVKGLSELKGKRFTFGSDSSTSGRLMPEYFLGQAGVKPSQFAGGAPGFRRRACTPVRPPNQTTSRLPVRKALTAAA